MSLPYFINYKIKGIQKKSDIGLFLNVIPIGIQNILPMSLHMTNPVAIKIMCLRHK